MEAIGGGTPPQVMATRLREPQASAPEPGATFPSQGGPAEVSRIRHRMPQRSRGSQEVDRLVTVVEVGGGVVPSNAATKSK